MHFVYILISRRDNNLYVGCTLNINNRLRQHNAGLVETTKYRLPLDLLYTEEFETAKEAFKLERALKGLWAARFKKKLKEKYLIQQKERKVI